MILILNHKSNLNFNEIKEYEKKLRKYNVIIMPSNCYLSLFQKGKYILGAQDVSQFSEKNRTGEITGNQLKSINVKYCLIGHNERKIYNKENIDILKSKIKNCIDNKIIPLYCIGEINNNKELEQQIDEYLDDSIIEKPYIIYEPINNIDSKNPNLDNIENNILYIKEYIYSKYKKDCLVIYGGGVNLDNINYLKTIKCIDGLIFSNSSLDIENVKKIYEKTNN